MPRYSKSDPTLEISKQEIIKLIQYVRYFRDKCLIAISYIIPVRPSELKTLTKESFSLVEETPKKIELKITTKKTRGKYLPLRHFEVIDDNTPIFKSIWIYVKSLREGETLFTISIRRMEQIIEKASIDVLGNSICPYTFRHHRLTDMSRKGAGLEKLMYSKGTTDIRSVEPYLHGKKQTVEIE